MAVAGVDMARAMTGAEVWWAGMWLWGMDKASDIKVAGGRGVKDPDMEVAGVRLGWWR